MRGCIYIRVSSIDQKMHGYSLDAQREHLQKYADEHDIKIVNVYADEGITASKALHKRKGILSLLDDAEKGLFDVILFKDLSRWSRNPSHFYAVEDRLEKAGVSWIAVDQPNLETLTASGKLIVGIHISVAAHESAQTSERIKYVNESRVRKKLPLHGDRWYPLGYKKGEIDGVPRVVVNEDERELVNAIFDEYERTQCISKVLRKVQEMGFQTYDSSLRSMFRNTLYKGEYRGVTEYCEPFLSPERWEKIKRISETHHYTAPIVENEYTFTSLVKCAECGGSMTGKTCRGYTYYGCKKHQTNKCENRKMMREEVIEDELIRLTDAELSRLRATIKDNAVKRNPAPIKSKLERLKDLYIDGDISKDEYTRRKDQYEQELAKIEKPVATPTIFVDDWKEYYKNAPKSARNLAWRSIVDKIICDRDGNISVQFLSF